MSPAALFSELAIVLDVASESPLVTADAEKAALTYTHKCRKLLPEASLNKPLKPETDQKDFDDGMAVFLRRDPALYSETRETLGITPATTVAERGSSAFQ